MLGMREEKPPTCAHCSQRSHGKKSQRTKPGRIMETLVQWILDHLLEATIFVAVLLISVILKFTEEDE
jgi:hypothetical protein